jgi:hypothetical protein
MERARWDIATRYPFLGAVDQLRAQLLGHPVR